MIPKIFSDIILLFIGYLYPAFESNKAIKTNTNINYWLRYWVIFGIFKIIEPTLDFLISWLPFYEETKIMLILTLIKPQMQGSKIVYQQLIKPLLNKYEPEFDKFNSQFSLRRITTAASAIYNLSKYVGRFIMKLAKKNQVLDQTNRSPVGPTSAPDEIEDIFSQDFSTTNTPAPSPRSSCSKSDQNKQEQQDLFSCTDFMK